MERVSEREVTQKRLLHSRIDAVVHNTNIVPACSLLIKYLYFLEDTKTKHPWMIRFINFMCVMNIWSCLCRLRTKFSLSVIYSVCSCSASVFTITGLYFQF